MLDNLSKIQEESDNTSKFETVDGKPHLLSQDYNYAHVAAKFAGAEIASTIINSQDIANSLIQKYGSIPVLITSEGFVTSTTAIAKYI